MQSPHFRQKHIIKEVNICTCENSKTDIISHKLHYVGGKTNFLPVKIQFKYIYEFLPVTSRVNNQGGTEDELSISNQMLLQCAQVKSLWQQKSSSWSSGSSTVSNKQKWQKKSFWDFINNQIYSMYFQGYLERRWALPSKPHAHGNVMMEELERILYRIGQCPEYQWPHSLVPGECKVTE